MVSLKNIEKMRAENNVAGLLKVLKKSNDLRVLGAVEDALEEIGHRCPQPFIEALKDRNAFVHSGAAWILGNIKDPSTVEPLIEVLRDEGENVRFCQMTLSWLKQQRRQQSVRCLLIKSRRASQDRSMGDVTAQLS